MNTDLREEARQKIETCENDRMTNRLSVHACVGLLELSTIARGILVTDGLLKKAIVKILFSSPVSSGKYLTCFGGEVEDVKSSLAAGNKIGGSAVIDFFILPAIHPEILPAIEGKINPNPLEALGILETSTCASCIVAADVALKTSKVQLVKIHLARGIGGKAYFVLGGEVGEIESAMSAALRQLQNQRDKIVDQVIIPQATSELLAIF